MGRHLGGAVTALEAEKRAVQLESVANESGPVLGYAANARAAKLAYVEHESVAVARVVTLGYVVYAPDWVVLVARLAYAGHGQGSRLGCAVNGPPPDASA